MSNAARKWLRIQPEVIRNSDTHVVLPTHDLQVVSECPKPRSYK